MFTAGEAPGGVLSCSSTQSDCPNFCESLPSREVRGLCRSQEEVSGQYARLATTYYQRYLGRMTRDPYFTRWHSNSLSNPDAIILRNGSTIVRRMRIRRLRDSGEIHSVLPLGGVVLHDPNPTTRRMAIEAIGAIGSREIDHDDVRPFSFDAYYDTVDALCIGINDQVPRNRMEAVEALGRVGGMRAATVLGSVLVNEPVAEIRVEAARQLGAGEFRTSDFDTFSYIETVDLIRIGLSDEDPRVRRAAIQSLGEHGGIRAALALETVIRNDSNARLRRLAMRVMVDISDTYSTDLERMWTTDVLRLGLCDEERRNRALALQSIARVAE